jgi:4-hydroxybenzoate polyprenyltransferase
VSGAAPGRFRVALDLARAGNFPSVASNVLAALVLSAGGAWPAPRELALALLAGLLAYAGGATLNDVADASFDARHRPGRAIPRGALSLGAAAGLGAVELLAGLGLLLALGAAGFAVAGLGAVILAYNWLHKRWAGSVVLMAGCRVLLALAVATLPGHAPGPLLLGWVAALGMYIVGLSLIARREYVPGAPAARLGAWVGRLLAFIPFVDAAALVVAGAPGAALACAAAVPLGRLAQRHLAAN